MKTKYSYKGKEIFPVIEVYHDVMPYLGGISMRDFFLDKKKCADAQKAGREKIEKYFGKTGPNRAVSGPPLSYCHLSCLGAEIDYPVEADPNVRHLFTDIHEALDRIQELKSVNFDTQPITARYKEINTYLQKTFPDQQISLLSGFGAQGPLTSAVLLRGQDFILDAIDYPAETKKFLTLLTDSIIAFRKYVNEMNGLPAVSPEGSGLCDDFASLFSPDMWPEFVLPYWNQLLSGLTTGKNRTVHCENLSPAHLTHLSGAKITHYQPSVSDLLTIENVKANTGIPFDWLLYSYRITAMNDEEIQNWVDTAVKAGISIIRTQFGEYTVKAEKLDRIKSFLKAFEKYRV